MKFFLFFLIGYIVYFLLGMLLPFTIHPKVDPRYRQSFDPSSFSRQDGCRERAMLIEKNTDALIQRIQLIQAAKEEIILSTFDFRDDESGKDILSALYGAAERGVSVKILMDGYNCLLHMEGSRWFYALSSHPNAEIRIYNRLNFLLPWTIPGRMHDKYLIADNFGYIAGGRNINDLFLGDFIPKGQSRDRDILIFSGENGSGSIQSLRAYFSSVWSLPCCSSFHNNAALGKKKQIRQAASFLKERYWSLSEKYPSLLGPFDRAAALPCQKISLLTNPTHIFAKEPRLFYSLSRLMESARRETAIHTPYIACDRFMYQKLSDIARTVPSAKLIINSVENGDNLPASSDYLREKEKVLKTGFSVYEYDGGISYHGKSVLIDDSLCAIGSFNFDMRSAYIDTETMFVIDSKELSRQLKDSFQRIERDCRRAISFQESLPAASGAKMEMDGRKKRLLSLLRFLTSFIRYMV